MSIIIGVANIVEGKLASFEYKKTGNIIHYLLSEWNDVEYLSKFFKKNQKTIMHHPSIPLNYNFEDFVEDIEDDIYQYDNFISDISEGKTINLSKHFIPLSENKEENNVFTLKKKRCKFLRFYAICIDEDFYVVTGGAIKITRTMQDHKDTRYALGQLDYAKDWLEHHGLDLPKKLYSYFDSYKI